MTSYGSPWTSVKVNAFVGSSTINLVSGYPEIVYCKNNSDSPTDTTNCRRNGIDTGNPFTYNSTSTNGYPNGTSSGSFRYPITRERRAVLLRHAAARAVQRRRTDDLHAVGDADRQLRLPGRREVLPEQHRRQQQQRGDRLDGAANRAARNPGRPPTRTRVTVSSSASTSFRSQTTYSGRPNRTDCAARPTCTYAEEMTNFANWYAYYSTRMQMMKTAVGSRLPRTRRALPRGFHHDQSRDRRSARTGTRRSTRSRAPSERPGTRSFTRSVPAATRRCAKRCRASAGITPDSRPGSTPA